MNRISPSLISLLAGVGGSLLIERRICGHGENVLLRQSEGRAINIPPSKIYTRHMWTIRRRRLIDRHLRFTFQIFPLIFNSSLNIHKRY